MSIGRHAFCAGLVALTLGGCAVMEQQGETPLPAPPPPPAPRAVGVDPLTAAEHKKLVAQFGGEYKWLAAERYLNNILSQLTGSENPLGVTYKVTILNTPAVNAFALPNGNLYISRGLLALANDSSEVAAVMAHEISHVSAKHAAARAEREKRAALITEAASVIQSRQKSVEVESNQKLSFAGFSRAQEIEADRIGVALIARAGFDPYGAARLLASLGRSTALREELLGQKGGDQPDILSSHPSTPERIAQATNAARQIAAPGIGAADREGYLNAVSGVIYGDDAADGLVRGNKYVQPKLGFAFVAPEGYVLENASRALMGRDAAGQEALRLDSVAATAANSALDAYMTSGWLNGLVQSSVESASVNGFPAIFAIARAGDWNFRVALIRKDADIYRIVFAARAITDEADRRFRASINTFRALAPDEAAKAKPYKIEIVEAGAGDAPSTLAKRMAVAEKPLETFLMLNGLEPGARLEADKPYKIVAE